MRKSSGQCGIIYVYILGTKIASDLKLYGHKQLGWGNVELQFHKFKVFVDVH